MLDIIQTVMRGERENTQQFLVERIRETMKKATKDAVTKFLHLSKKLEGMMDLVRENLERSMAILR